MVTRSTLDPLEEARALVKLRYTRARALRPPMAQYADDFYPDVAGSGDEEEHIWSYEVGPLSLWLDVQRALGPAGLDPRHCTTLHPPQLPGRSAPV